MSILFSTSNVKIFLKTAEAGARDLKKHKFLYLY